MRGAVHVGLVRVKVDPFSGHVVICKKAARQLRELLGRVPLGQVLVQGGGEGGPKAAAAPARLLHVLIR